MIRRSILTLAAAVPLVAAGGCLDISASESNETGVRISMPTFNEIEIGTTTEAWVIATFGEPNRRTPVASEDNQEILEYHHVTHKSSGGVVLFVFLFAGGSDHTHRTVTYFEITDGVVTKYWTEG